MPPPPPLPAEQCSVSSPWPQAARGVGGPADCTLAARRSLAETPRGWGPPMWPSGRRRWWPLARGGCSWSTGSLSHAGGPSAPAGRRPLPGQRAKLAHKCDVTRALCLIFEAALRAPPVRSASFGGFLFPLGARRGVHKGNASFNCLFCAGVVRRPFGPRRFGAGRARMMKNQKRLASARSLLPAQMINQLNQF